MVLTTEEFALKAGLLVALVAVSNLQWSSALNPDAPALFHLGSLLPAVIFVPIVSVIPAAFFLGLVALTVGKRTGDHMRACFLMGLYVATLWIVYSKLTQISDIPLPSGARERDNGFWYIAYVWAFIYSLPGVSLPGKKANSPPTKPTNKTNDGLNAQGNHARGSDAPIRMTERTDPIQFVHNMLRAMLSKQGSGINLAAGVPPKMLVRGEWIPIANLNLEAYHTREIAYALMTSAEATEFSERKECRFSIKPIGIGNFNVRVFFDDRAIAIEFCIPDEKAQSDSHGAGTFKWYVVLGVSENASVNEVRAAYRKLMQEYHPDRVANLGRELRDLAELKSKEITQAFRDFERHSNNNA